MKNKVILVDKNNSIIGKEDKLIAHKKALLHRAFSIFVFNNKEELLIQRRALSKYHTPGLWSNTYCSHQQPGESTLSAANSRLFEEMGIVCEFHEIGQIYYKFKLDEDIWEHEYDHILIGNYNGTVTPNPKEVLKYRWISLESLKTEMSLNNRIFTPWFKIILEKYFYLCKS